MLRFEKRAKTLCGELLEGLLDPVYSPLLPLLLPPAPWSAATPRSRPLDSPIINTPSSSMETPTTTTMLDSLTPPAQVDYCLCGNALPTRPPTPSSSASSDDEGPSIYCSVACARQDALDSLMAKATPRHSASSSTSSTGPAMTSATSTLIMDHAISEKTVADSVPTTSHSTSNSASSSLCFSSSTSSSSSSMSQMPFTPATSGEYFGSSQSFGQDIELDLDHEDGCVFEIVTSPSSPSQPQLSSPGIQSAGQFDSAEARFKSHYQRVVARQNALNGASVLFPGSPPTPPRQTSVAPTSPPGLSSHAAPHSPPGLKRVKGRVNLQDSSADASKSDSFSYDSESDEDRSRTPVSWEQTQASSMTAVPAGLVSETRRVSPPPSYASSPEEAEPRMRTMSEIMRSIVDREPDVLEDYASFVYESDQSAIDGQASYTEQCISSSMTDEAKTAIVLDEEEDEFAGDVVYYRDMTSLEVILLGLGLAFAHSPSPAPAPLSPKQKCYSPREVLEAMAQQKSAPLYTPKEVLESLAHNLPAPTPRSPPSTKVGLGLSKKRSLFGGLGLAPIDTRVANVSGKRSTGLLRKFLPGRDAKKAQNQSPTVEQESEREIETIVIGHSSLSPVAQEQEPELAAAALSPSFIPEVDDILPSPLNALTATAPTEIYPSTSNQTFFNSGSMPRSSEPAPRRAPTPAFFSASASATAPRKSAPSPSSPYTSTSAPRSSMELMNESDDEDVSDPFRYDALIPKTASASSSPRSATMTRTESSRARLAPPIANVPEDVEVSDSEEDDNNTIYGEEDDGNESEENEQRVWDIVQQQTTRLQACLLAIDSSL